MVDIFITDSRDRYDQSKNADKILYLDGYIGECSFIDKNKIDDFNTSLVGLEDEANRLMLQKLDEDTKTMIDRGLYSFSSNRYIDRLAPEEKIHSTLFNFHRRFIYKKYLFQLVFDKFFLSFSVSQMPLLLELSESYSLTQDLPYLFASTIYYEAYKNVFVKFLFKQVYYLFYTLFRKKEKLQKTDIAIFLLDIHNEFDVIKRFAKLVKLQNKLSLTLILIDSGNPQNKKIDISGYKSENLHITYLHNHKSPSFNSYSSFYDACRKINPLYGIYQKARLCELEDIQYSFFNNIISTIQPQVCLYTNTQEYGRVLSNVCATHTIPSICVDYSFFFDTYNIEKRIKFDTRACISEISSYNWKKHKDPTPRHEIIGFCKIDDWQEKLTLRKQSTSDRPFDNNNRTILFASTWAPNPDSPLLTEKARIVEQLSDMCQRHGWNLIIKKHPSEFDTRVDDVFKNSKSVNQKVFEHNQMSLFDCVYYSDFVCTQNSSAFIETLYLNKPFSYITVNGENTWAGLSYFSKEKEVGTFGSVSEYEQYLTDHAGKATYQKLLDDFMKLQTKYLYKTDGKASERLLELTQSYIK